MISLIVAWILIYLCVMKGIKSSGKVMYATATFPYVVTTIFLIRSITLEGAVEGLLYMINPDVSLPGSVGSFFTLVSCLKSTTAIMHGRARM